MSIPIATLSSPTFKISSLSRLSIRIPKQTIAVCSLPIKTQPFNPKLTHKRFEPLRTRKLGFSLNAADNGEVESKNSVNEDDGCRGESTMPERFRYLTKEVPDPPVRWPWFVALGFLLYTWRAVLFELGNWKRSAQAIVSFVGYLLKLLLAVIFHFIGDPITSLIRCIETLIYAARAYYSGIIHYAPIWELTLIIVLSSAILAIAEAAAPISITCQPYLLTLSGLIGYGAVSNYIIEPFFWTLLLGIYAFSRFIKKRDHVTSALPAAAVMAAIGEPWVRVLVILSYLALAIHQHSKKISEGKEEIENVATRQRVPVPLLCAALAIGIRLAANWAGYRHLTWKIV